MVLLEVTHRRVIDHWVRTKGLFDCVIVFHSVICILFCVHILVNVDKNDQQESERESRTCYLTPLATIGPTNGIEVRLLYIWLTVKESTSLKELKFLIWHLSSTSIQNREFLLLEVDDGVFHHDRY